MGSLALARAELEAAAGRGMLDEPALLDLAEVRWRTGDLAGAGEAAHALLARGLEAPLALVIAAESVAALGRPSEARRLAGRALEGRRPARPAVRGHAPEHRSGPPIGRARHRPAATPAALARAPVPRRGAPRSPRRRPAPPRRSPAGGRRSRAGDTAEAALRLSVAMRLEPGYARASSPRSGARRSIRRSRSSPAMRSGCSAASPRRSRRSTSPGATSTRQTAGDAEAAGDPQDDAADAPA